jgi:phosphoribosyl-ATP pyrophosphohydrolase/phosphoribosyl-AMP cyclohydrolase
LKQDRKANYSETLKKINWNEQGLIPVVVQDVESGEVLMLAYMNEQALLKTIEEGKACYFSRSRNSLWVKGETSGNFQEVVDIYLDCDQDAVLLKVKQIGRACHKNSFSCFHYQLGEEKESGEVSITALPKKGRPDLSLGRTLVLLAEIIKERKKERPVDSYTTYLFNSGLDKILKKVGEESAEVIIAAKNNSLSELRYETADLLYHLLVLLEEKELNLQEIAQELNARRK